MLFLNVSLRMSLVPALLVRLLTVAVSGGTPRVCGEATPVLLLYRLSPSSLIVDRSPFGTCGHDSASWLRIALLPPVQVRHHRPLARHRRLPERPVGEIKADAGQVRLLQRHEVRVVDVPAVDRAHDVLLLR